MSVNLHDVAAEAEAGLRKFKAIVDAVAGSPVTHAMEKLVPGLSRLVADVEAAARIAGVIGGFMPMLPTVISVIEALGALHIRPMDAADPAFLAREKELGG